MLLESLTDNVLVGVEGKISDEQGRALGAGLVTVRASTRLSLVTGSALLGSVTGFGVVEVDGTVVNLSVFLGFVGSLGAGSVDVFDVTESRRNLLDIAGPNKAQYVHSPSRTTGLALSHDADTSKFTEFLKLAAEPFLVDVPGQVTGEQVRGVVGGNLGLGLLGAGSSLLLSLALLGSFFLVRRIRVLFI